MMGNFCTLSPLTIQHIPSSLRLVQHLLPFSIDLLIFLAVIARKSLSLSNPFRCTRFYHLSSLLVLNAFLSIWHLSATKSHNVCMQVRSQDIPEKRGVEGDSLLTPSDWIQMRPKEASGEWQGLVVLLCFEVGCGMLFRLCEMAVFL